TAVGEPDLQVGVVSWGVGCAHDAFPGWVYARVSEKYEWIRAEVCNRSADPPAYFNCGELRTQETSPSESAWEEIVDEEFLTGLGIFNSHGNGDSSRHYPTAQNRAGVVRVASGGGTASLASRSISLADTSYGRLRVSFSFYAMGTEHADDLCLDYELDNGAITGERCWSSLHAFQNNQWTDLDMEFNASPGARNISLSHSASSSYHFHDLAVLEGHSGRAAPRAFKMWYPCGRTPTITKKHAEQSQASTVPTVDGRLVDCSPPEASPFCIDTGPYSTTSPVRSSGVGLPPEVDRGSSCTATSVSAKRGSQIVLRRARACRTRSKHVGPRSASVGPYSATVASIETEPATPIRRSRPSDGSAAISLPTANRSITWCAVQSSSSEGPPPPAGAPRGPPPGPAEDRREGPPAHDVLAPDRCHRLMRNVPPISPGHRKSMPGKVFRASSPSLVGRHAPELFQEGVWGAFVSTPKREDPDIRRLQTSPKLGVRYPGRGRCNDAGQTERETALLSGAFFS
ncbi:hypothetical protein THAOC_08254, partial [Thalassiosira oceanica]